MGSGDKLMRIRFTDTQEEHQISGIPEHGNSVANGRYVSKQGVLCDNVEDITDYDADGVEIIPEPPQFQEDVEVMLELP